MVLGRLGALLVFSLALALLLDTPALGRTGLDGQQRLASPVGARSTARSLFPRFHRAIPVLLYHRLVPSNGGYSVAPAAFQAQLARLHELGFEAITLGQYLRFVRGGMHDMPPRPLLITFDDAYRSSVAHADQLLAAYGWSAVMYVPTGAVGRPEHLTWAELRDMQSSGRWQIDEHAGDGHTLITVDAAGRRLPSYAGKRWSSGKNESFAHYKRRVSRDIELGSALLARNLPGWTSRGSFAVPFNNYGQNGSNDPRIAPWLSRFLKTRFAVVFLQHDDSFTTPRPGLQNRITVSSHWSADTLETHLRRGVAGLGPPA